MVLSSIQLFRCWTSCLNCIFVITLLLQLTVHTALIAQEDGTDQEQTVDEAKNVLQVFSLCNFAEAEHNFGFLAAVAIKVSSTW